MCGEERSNVQVRYFSRAIEIVLAGFDAHYPTVLMHSKIVTLVCMINVGVGIPFAGPRCTVLPKDVEIA
jgi:hypothetical protein